MPAAPLAVHVLKIGKSGPTMSGGIAHPDQAPGVVAIVGSLYVSLQDGTWWRKDGDLDTEWISVNSQLDARMLNGDSVSLANGTPVSLVGVMANRANASDQALSQVLGIVLIGAAPGAQVSLVTQGSILLEVAEWAVVTGDPAGLDTGSDYYLDTVAGKLTITPPDQSGQSITYIGRAMTDRLLLLQIARPILL